MSAFERPKGSGQWAAKFQLKGRQRWVPGGPWATRERAERAEVAHRQRIERGGWRRHGPQTIYCLFAGNEPVYVGITGVNVGRLKQHRADKAWWPQITSATFEHFEDPQVAVDRELELIAKLQPRFNRYQPARDDKSPETGSSAVTDLSEGDGEPHEEALCPGR